MELEEEIIKYLVAMEKEYKQFGDLHNPDYEDERKIHQAIQGLLDLYEQEKEKNKELENTDLNIVYMTGFYDGKNKWKDKIREKIKEYDGLKEIDMQAYQEQIKPLKELLEEE